MMMKAINIANDKKYPEEPTLMFELIGTGLVDLYPDCELQRLPHLSLFSAR
jgi:hypothetical protein